MNQQKKYHGVIIPMVTPFMQDGTIDKQATSGLIFEPGAFLVQPEV